MIRTKLGLLGLCAVVVGMMAMSASAAQGATLSWLILNSTHTTATNLLAKLVGEKDSEHLVLLTKLLGLMVSITCTNFELINTYIEPVEKIQNNAQVKFTGCTAREGDTLGTAFPNCEVSSAGQPIGTILTEKGHGLLVLHKLTGGGEEVLTELLPDVVGGPFAIILIKNCVLPESNPVKGALFLKDCEGFATTHKVKHLVIQGPLTSLFVGADTAEHLETSLRGSAWIKLGQTPAGVNHTGLEWAAMDA
jgi:hypothetical protein